MKQCNLTLIIGAILCCFLSYQTVYAKDQPIAINGKATLSHKKLDSVQVNGTLKFNKLIVHEKLYVNGSIKGQKLKCKILDINGLFNGEFVEAEEVSVLGTFMGNKINISGKTSIFGLLNVSESSFADITVNGENIILKNSTANNIYVKKNTSKGTSQELTLAGKSTISGDVTFESGKGIINLSKDAKILGKITGAEINKVK